jgi:hypothetical protein
VKPRTASTDWNASYASAGVTRVGEEDAHLAAHALVQNEVLPSHLADEARQHGDVDVLEVEGDGRRVVGGVDGRRQQQREQRGREPPHRKS